MLLDVKFWSKEQYLPTKRHRKLRTRYVQNSMEVEIKEVTAQEFPVSFVVKTYDWRWENNENSARYGMFDTEIRTYNEKLWKAIRYSDCVSHASGWVPISYIAHKLEDRTHFWKGGDDFTEASIVRADDVAEHQKAILGRAANYVIFDGKVWTTCGEPMYVVNTFGLGHNHGGTGLFVDYYYNENICNKNYFNALEREQAIAYGKQVAEQRGDTENIETIEKHADIEVLMPQMVKRNPQKDHGNGDPFINSMETLISNSNSVEESQILCLAHLLGSI